MSVFKIDAPFVERMRAGGPDNCEQVSEEAASSASWGYVQLILRLGGNVDRR
jgi:hypothetical protein